MNVIFEFPPRDIFTGSSGCWQKSNQGNTKLLIKAMLVAMRWSGKTIYMSVFNTYKHVAVCIWNGWTKNCYSLNRAVTFLIRNLLIQGTCWCFLTKHCSDIYLFIIFSIKITKLCFRNQHIHSKINIHVLFISLSIFQLFILTTRNIINQHYSKRFRDWRLNFLLLFLWVPRFLEWINVSWCESDYVRSMPVLYCNFWIMNSIP